MSWLPFPFPECPRCHQQWAYSYHHECPRGGQVEVDPDSRLVRCEACRTDWNVASNQFICACGNKFNTADVQAAIEDIIATARLFAFIVEGNQREAAKAHALGEGSLRAWIQGVALGVGGHVGGLLGTIAGSLARILFGPHLQICRMKLSRLATYRHSDRCRGSHSGKPAPVDAQNRRICLLSWQHVSRLYLVQNRQPIRAHRPVLLVYGMRSVPGLSGQFCLIGVDGF
jgi:hypothetical protein